MSRTCDRLQELIEAMEHGITHPRVNLRKGPKEADRRHGHWSSACHDWSLLLIDRMGSSHTASATPQPTLDNGERCWQ